jgi:transcriptional regulator with XRE-family HTH domain
MTGFAFRNVDLSPDDPVSAWPLEAIQTALERGGLSYWRRLADEIGAHPWGPVARRVEEVLGYSRPYGVAVAMERAVARARETAETSEREAVAKEVERLVHESGLSRAEFATGIGTSASRLSTYATGKVTPSAALLVRMRNATAQARRAGSSPDPHDIELGEILLELTPEERLRACGATPACVRSPQSRDDRADRERLLRTLV